MNILAKGSPFKVTVRIALSSSLKQVGCCYDDPSILGWGGGGDIINSSNSNV